MGIWSAYIHVHEVPVEVRKWVYGFGYFGTGAEDSCEPSQGCWELNLGHLVKQLVLLTAEPSL